MKNNGLSGNISEDSSYIRIKEEFDKFRELDEALQKYKLDTVNTLIEKKQNLLQVITDARRERQVELNKQEHRRDKYKSLRVDPDVSDPQLQSSSNDPDPRASPEVTPGSSGVDVELI